MQQVGQVGLYRAAWEGSWYSFKPSQDFSGGRPQEAAVDNPSTPTPEVPTASFGSQAPQPFRCRQGEFGENRPNATIEAPASYAHQNNSDPFKSRFSHLSIQEFVPAGRKVKIQDPQARIFLGWSEFRK
jgi:hypothetical protein